MEWNMFKWKSRFTEHEFAEIMALLQSEDEEDFLLGKAILEAKNIKLGKDRLHTIDTHLWHFIYNCGELTRVGVRSCFKDMYGIWRIKDNKGTILWRGTYKQ